jgi:hypothetical protein
MARFRRIQLVAVLVLASVAPSIVRADMYGFYNITGNNAVNAALGEAQLRMEVTDPGGGQVLFRFLNLGPAASSITDVYFDDSHNDGNPLVSLATITNGPGVSFSQGASPPNLPGANSVSPAFSADFDLDSIAPVESNGVNPDEWLEVKFNLATGVGFSNVIGELDAGTLRVGIHVQGFANGGSEAFINNIKPMPAPGAFLLGALGLGLIAGRGRLRLRRDSGRR